MATASVPYTFAPSTLILSSEVNGNFAELVSFLNTEVIHKDASVAFTAVPSGPATDPSSDNQLVRLAYMNKRMGYSVSTASGTHAHSAGVTPTVIDGFSSAYNTTGLFTQSASRITFSVDMVALVGGWVRWEDNDNGHRKLALRKSGSILRGEAASQFDVDGVGGGFGIISVEGFTAGQYIDMIGCQSSGSSLDYTGRLFALTVALL